MDRETLLHRVAPCSLLCYTCLASRDGAFSECSPRLLAYTEGVGEFLSERMPEKEREAFLASFRSFRDSLGHMRGGMCHGCRSDAACKSGCITACAIPACVREHGVDFCAECSEFPCQRTADFFDEDLRAVWESGSRRIQEIGIETYYAEKKDASHYAHKVQK